MKNTSDTYWAQAIQPIVDFCAITPGAKAEIIREMNRLGTTSSRKPWNRQQVESYLHADARKRNQPLLGAGLLMQQAFFMVMARSYNIPATAKLEGQYVVWLEPGDGCQRIRPLTQFGKKGGVK